MRVFPVVVKIPRRSPLLTSIDHPPNLLPSQRVWQSDLVADILATVWETSQPISG